MFRLHDMVVVTEEQFNGTGPAEEGKEAREESHRLKEAKVLNKARRRRSTRPKERSLDTSYRTSIHSPNSSSHGKNNSNHNHNSQKSRNSSNLRNNNSKTNLNLNCRNCSVPESGIAPTPTTDTTSGTPSKDGALVENRQELHM